MKIAFKTFGCKANMVDSDALFHEAQHRGFEIVPESELADAYIINSCTVTEAADRDARVHANRYKRRNPAALVGVIGCYAQVGTAELLGIPEVDFIVGTANKNRILDHFEMTWEGKTPGRDQVEPAMGYLPEIFPGSRNARAPIKIQDGCNFSCSFCIIPQARGRSRSLPPEVVLKQIDDAYAQGFQEVVLTGIHIAHYGWDQGTDLYRLIQSALAKEKGPRLRVSTLDPFEMPDSLISLLDHPRLCPHFHIALQSGSDKVLTGMRRIYKAAEFTDATERIQRKNADTFIGVDVIVGFPGEAEEDFAETEKVLRDSFWAKLHVFPYSRREGTRAATLEDRSAEAAASERSATLRGLSDERHEAFGRKQIGKMREVILEKPSRKLPGYWQGHTENYLPTLTHAPEGSTRSLVHVAAMDWQQNRLLTSIPGVA